MLDMRRLNLRSTAFHEAGHAVFALAQGIRFSTVWLFRRSDSEPVPQNQPLGQLTRVTPLNKTDFAGKNEEAEVEAVQAFVGPVAECLAYPGWQPNFEVNHSDYVDARGVLRFAIIPFTLTATGADFAQADLQRAEPQMQRILNECLQRAVQFVNANKARIEKVAMELLAKWELTEDEVRTLCV